MMKRKLAAIALAGAVVFSSNTIAGAQTDAADNPGLEVVEPGAAATRNGTLTNNTSVSTESEIQTAEDTSTTPAASDTTTTTDSEAAATPAASKSNDKTKILLIVAGVIAALAAVIGVGVMAMPKPVA